MVSRTLILTTLLRSLMIAPEKERIVCFLHGLVEQLFEVIRC
jgi:hypothetical protein